LHADTSAHRIDVLVFGHHGDLGALPRLTGNGANHNRVVVNLGYLSLEEVTHQLGSGAGNHDLRALGGPLDPHDDDARPLAGSKRFQSRLLLARHAPFGLTQIDDHVLALGPLYRGVNDLADAPDVLVIDRIALGLAHLLKDDLLGKLGGNASQHVSRLIGAQFAAHFGRGIDPLGIVERDLRERVLDQIVSLDNGAHRIGADLAAFFIELRAQVLLRLVVLARGDDNGVFDRGNHNLWIDALLAAESVDYVVQFTRHKNLLARRWP